MYRVGIITASDKGSRGERVDESGAKIKEVVGEFGYEVKAVSHDDDPTKQTELFDSAIADKMKLI